MEIEDLWGDLPPVDVVRTPTVVLKEQGELLKQKTKGLLVCHVPRDRESGTDISGAFFIVAPALGEYRYKVLDFSYGLGIYPAHVLGDIHTSYVECKDEGEFLNIVKSIFSSDQIRAVISRLIGHIKAEGRDA